MTDAMFRAMIAVSSGNVERQYQTSGNVLRGPKGVSPSTLWKLDRLGWIEDRPSGKGTHRTQVLTKSGRDALSNI